MEKRERKVKCKWCKQWIYRSDGVPMYRALSRNRNNVSYICTHHFEFESTICSDGTPAAMTDGQTSDYR